jgi:hypothetical protein
MKKFVALLFTTALLSPLFAQGMAKTSAVLAAPAMTVGDEAQAPTPEKKKTVRRARKAKRAKKQAAADAAAAPAPTNP